MEYVAKEVCTEISTIIKYMPKEYQNKIPTNVMEFFEKNKTNNYKVNINPNNIFDKSNIKEETLAIIAMLNIKYWCPNENLKKQLIKNMMKMKNNISEKLEKHIIQIIYLKTEIIVNYIQTEFQQRKLQL